MLVQLNYLTGSGTIHLVNDGLIGNTSSSSEVVKTDSNSDQTYDNGSIFDYCASANQYIPTIHPSSSLIYTSGSGTKMLLISEHFGKFRLIDR